MYKIKNAPTITAMNTAAITIALLLIKLFYFNIQIGDKRFLGLHGLAALGPLLIIASVSMLLKPKTAVWYMRIINILLTVLIFSNLIFFRYFNDLISIPLLFQAGNLSDIQSSMLQLLHWEDLLLAADFVLLPLIRKAMGMRENKTVRRKVKPWGFVTVFTIGLMIVLIGFSQLVKSQPTILQTFYDRVYVAQNIGLLNYHAADIYTFAEQSMKDGSKLDEQKQQEIFEFFKSQKEAPKENQLLSGAGQGKNLIVIQVEALQQFVINKSVNGQEITPNLNKLISKSIYFDNYYFQTAGGGTSDAEFTANMSMFPMKEGAVYIRKPGNYYYSLPLKLKETGYSTVAMHGYKPGFWNRSVVYNNIGFDEFYNKNNMKENEILGMGISDKDFFRQAAEKLKAQKQPYFSFLITLSSHFPYENDRSKYSSFDVGEYKDTLLGNYLEAVHYTDEALGQFVDELEKSGILKDTVLAIYGDHHAIPKDNMKELAKFLGKDDLSPLEWQQLQKVPLIINVPDTEGMTVTTAGGGVDFMPTLLNIMGVNDQNLPSFGRDLINSQDGMAVLRNGSFVTNDKVYISAESQCYDAKTGEIIPKEAYKSQKQQAEKYLEYSDTIIKYDLEDEIRAYLEKQKP